MALNKQTEKSDITTPNPNTEAKSKDIIVCAQDSYMRYYPTITSQELVLRVNSHKKNVSNLGHLKGPKYCRKIMAVGLSCGECQKNGFNTLV